MVDPEPVALRERRAGSRPRPQGPKGSPCNSAAPPVSSQADQPPGVEGALCSGFNAPEAALLSASARPLLGFLLAAAQRELTSERKGVQCPHAAPAPMRGSPAAALSQDRTEPTSKEGRAAGGAAGGRTRGRGGGGIVPAQRPPPRRSQLMLPVPTHRTPLLAGPRGRAPCTRV